MKPIARDGTLRGSLPGRVFNRSEAYNNRDGGKGKLRKPLPDHGTRARYRHRIYPCDCEQCRRADVQERAQSPKLLWANLRQDGSTMEEIRRLRAID